jgi:hypothetical protein
MGSRSDSNFGSGKDSYGAMPTSGLSLLIPFNRKLAGPPYEITFEFYNDGGAAVSVNLFAVTSEERSQPKPMEPAPSHQPEPTAGNGS